MDRCELCGRFVGEDALEGWTGGLFGDYNGKLYCPRHAEEDESGAIDTPGEVSGDSPRT